MHACSLFTRVPTVTHLNCLTMLLRDSIILKKFWGDRSRHPPAFVRSVLSSSEGVGHLLQRLFRPHF